MMYRMRVEMEWQSGGGDVRVTDYTEIRLLTAFSTAELERLTRGLDVQRFSTQLGAWFTYRLVGEAVQERLF